MNYVYIQTEKAGHGFETRDLFTVGFYQPDGKFYPESDHPTSEKAAERVAYLNGAGAVRRTLDEALNSGDGTYRP
jgi:hypothetical protein